MKPENHASCGINCFSIKGRQIELTYGKPAFNAGVLRRPVLIVALIFTISLIPASVKCLPLSILTNTSFP